MRPNSRLASLRLKSARYPMMVGDYLKFLIAVRELVENSGTASERRRKLELELREQRWQPFMHQLGGTQAVANRLIPSFLSTIGLPEKAVAQMISAGLTTAGKIAAVPDVQLLAIDGVGLVKLKAIRERCSQCLHPDDEYVDDLIR